MVAEKQENSGEEDYLINKRKEQIEQTKILLIPIIALLIIVANTYLQLQQHIILSTVLLSFLLGVLMLLGIIVTALLLLHEVDHTNPLLKQICSTGAKTNCAAILNSKQSKLFNTFSWSEIGFIYFLGGFFSILMLQSAAIPVLVCLNVLALPYTFFSVYYQWKVAKQWCVLCLTVQALLLTEFLAILFTNSFISSISTIQETITINLILQLITIFLLPILIWFILKPNLVKAKESKQNMRSLMRLKFDSKVFNALLAKQKQIKENSQGLGIHIGNPNAINTIIKVCNPYCGPCATAHPEIEAILEANPNVKAQIIFTASNTVEDRRAKPVKHLLAIAAQNNEAQTKQALDDWYLAKEKNYEQFAFKYPLNGELEQQGVEVEKMNEWCKNTEINFTPTIFINGYQMPDMYSIKDLKYLLS